MQDKKWVRVGLATLILGAAFGCVSAAGCGSSSSPVVAGDASPDHTSSSSGSSSGVSGSSSGTSGSSSGGTTDGGDGGTPPNANVYLVNAVVDTKAPPTFRFCFGIPSVTDGGPVSVIGGYDPLPDTKAVAYAPAAGLPAGTGGLLNSNKQIQSINLASLSLKVYALSGSNPIVASDTADAGPDGGAEAPCEYLIGSDALGATTTGNPMPYKGVLTENTDYWYVGEITKGELASGTTWVAALEGCVPGETDTTQQALCGGAAYVGATNGTLALQLIQLDNTTKLDGGSLGAQFGQISVEWSAYLAGSGSPPPTGAGFYIPTPIPEAGTGDAGDGGDAGDAATAPFNPVTQLAPFEITAVYPPGLEQSTLSPISGLTFDGGSGFYAAGWNGSAPIFAPPTEDGGQCTPGSQNPLEACVSPWFMSLPDINALSVGPTAPNEFQNGAGYVFLLVGSPAAPSYIDYTTGNPCDPTAGGATCIFNTDFIHFLAFPTL
jgi:hypothetical protein